MQVDFYQLAGMPAEQIIASISGKLLGEGSRLLIIAAEEAALSRLDRQLWDHGTAGFLPHGIAGGADDARQPILLSTTPDAPNLARNILIADGVWRDAALAYDRAFFLFDGETLVDARAAWKLLAGREDIERRYWTQDDGRWQRQA